MTIFITTFIVFFLIGAAMLNYLDTGKIYKILPGHKLRFWGHTLGMATLAALLMFTVSYQA